MTIFLKDKLKSLNYFIDRMCEGAEDAYVLDISEQTFYQKLLELEPRINETTHVITFNNVGIYVSTSAGANFWEVKKVKLHNIYVDSPIWYKDTLKLGLKCMQIITIDGYHEEFVRKCFPECQSVHFLPHGGARLADADEIAYEERPIDVLYVGDRKEMAGEDEYSFLSERDRELIKTVRHMLMKDPNLTPEKVLAMCRDEEGMELSADKIIDGVFVLYCAALNYVRGYYQGKVIEALAEAGIHIDIYPAHCWKELGEKYPDYVHLHEGIGPEECIKLMRKSKITLNMMPWFKYGAHERIYNAMLNGSVCVSDTSEYLQKHFKSGRNIVLFELNNLDNLVSNVRLALKNPSFAKHIIENQKKTVAKSIWRDRLDNILGQRFEEGKDFI